MKTPSAYIIAAPRSGTTWLQTILSNLPGIVCVESRPYGDFFEMWPEANGDYGPRMTIDAYARILSGYISVSESIDEEKVTAMKQIFSFKATEAIYDCIHETVKSCLDASIIIEKITPYLGTSELVLDRIVQRSPDVPLIQLTRDGRDVVTSGLFHWIRRNAHGSSRYKYLIGKRKRLSRFFDDDELRKWCRYWAEPLKAMEASGDKFLSVHYEEMKKDIVNVLFSILKYLDISFSEEIVKKACAQADLKNVRSANLGEPGAHVRKGIVGDWRKYFTKRDAVLFIEETADLLISCGYVNDHTWIDDLPMKLDLRAGGY